MSLPAGRSARGDINRLPCVFAAALYRRCAVCGLAASSGDTPQDEIRCTQPLARANCARLDGLLREKSRFAVKAREHPLETVAAEQKSAALRVQCGGLTALGALLTPDSMAVDVERLLGAALAQPAGLEGLPFERAVAAIVRWKA